MKKSIIFILTSIFLISLFSCDVLENLFNSDEDPVGGNSIIGEWKESNALINLVLTTNSAQQATNFLNSTGEIAISGDYNTKLKLMLYLKGGVDDEPGLIVTNSLLGVGETDTSYTLYLDPTEVDKNGELEVSVDDDSNFFDELTNNLINYTFNETTLNITNSTVTSGQTGKSAALNGTITLDNVNIPANQPTTLALNSEHFYDFGSTTTFNKDSTFISSESTEAGDNGGTWSIIGDTLKISVSITPDEVDGETPEPIDTTLTFIYINNGNEFNISQSFNICEGLSAEGTDDETGCDDVLNIIELLFNLDEGSIVKAELIYQLFFERIPDNQVAKLSNHTRNSLENSIPQAFNQFLANSKKIIH